MTHRINCLGRLIQSACNRFEKEVIQSVIQLQNLIILEQQGRWKPVNGFVLGSIRFSNQISRNNCLESFFLNQVPHIRIIEIQQTLPSLSSKSEISN